MGRSSSAWENTCVLQPGDEGPSSSRKLCKKLPRNWRIEKTLFSIGKDWKNIEDWKNFPRSMIRNPEQWVCWEIKYEAYKNDWNLLKTEKSGMILTHWAVTTVPTFLITSSSRKPKREVGMPRNTRENMSIPGHNFFLIVNMLDEILMNYTMIQEIWRHHRRFREEKELRKVRAKNHCKQYLYLAFRYKQGKKSRRQELSYVYD